MVREYTNKLRDLLDEGAITQEAVVDMALAYMSEDDVKDMCRSNDLLLDDDELEEDEDEDEDDEEPVLFHALGNPGTDDVSLYESNYYAEIKTWTDNYVRTGFGGYDVIEVGYFSDNDEWIAFDTYEADRDEDDLYSDLD